MGLLDVPAIPVSQKAAANGVATLGADSKIPTAQLPSLVITDTFVVNSQAAMLALTAQRGDVAIRTDSTPNIAYILTADDPTTLGNWRALDPATTVTAVNGGTGAVTITATGLGALVAASNLSDLTNPATARTNLGLGSASTHPIGDFLPIAGSDAWLMLHAAGNLDALIVGAITRDANGAATSAPVVWPDGTIGTYTATTVSTTFPGAVDAYTVTYGSPATKTVTQSAVTRDATTGAVTNRPAMTVA